MIYLIEYDHSIDYSDYDLVKVNIMTDNSNIIEIPNKLFMYNKQNNILDKSSVSRELNRIVYGIIENYTLKTPDEYKKYNFRLSSMRDVVSVNLIFRYGLYSIDNLNYYINNDNVIVNVPRYFEYDRIFTNRDNISLSDDSRINLNNYINSIVNKQLSLNSTSSKPII